MDLAQVIADAVTLEEQYCEEEMLSAWPELWEPEWSPLRFGRDSAGDLIEAFAPIGLTILGPSIDRARRLCRGHRPPLPSTVCRPQRRRPSVSKGG